MEGRAGAATIVELGLRLLVTGSLLVAAALVLGSPSWSEVSSFFLSPVPTFDSALAATSLLVWVIVLAALGLSLAAVVRALGRRLDRWQPQRRRLWGVFVMVAGLLVLTAGLSHHHTRGTVTLSGGSVQEARQELAR